MCDRESFLLQCRWMVFQRKCTSIKHSSQSASSFLSFLLQKFCACWCVCVCSPVCLQCVHLYTLSLHHCNMFGNCIAAVWHSEMRALRIMKWKCQSSVVNMPIFDICTLSLAQEIFKNNCFRIAIRFISLPHKDKQTPFRNIICRMGEIFGSVFLIRLPSMFVDLIEVIIDPSRNSTSLAKFLSMLSLSTSPHRIAIYCCCDQAGHLYVSIVCIFDWINKFVYV